MNLVTKSLAVVAALFMLSACDSMSNSSSSKDGSGSIGGNTSGTGTMGYLDEKQTVGDRVFFDLDQSDLTAEAQHTLELQAAWLKQYPNVNVTVEGHCDERGTREYNLALGERRATAAKKYLVGLGVSAGRISTISYGKERPAAMGSDESAWAQNRRAVSVIVNK